jgi:hypothetical protein
MKRFNDAPKLMEFGDAESSTKQRERRMGRRFV